jgi:hypothetical protein
MTESDCRNDCVEALRFPLRPNNRPSLAHINYRIGTYSDFRDFLLRNLDKDDVLADWTHREPEDPGIALLEGAAILADILTFYQELYANEAYLRTAQWRESIADLVRLFGYRLSPGLGGNATFAFGVKGSQPVVISPGFPIKAQLEPATPPAEFQSLDQVIAYPHLSQFHLYRRRSPAALIMAGGNRLEVQSVGSNTDVESITAVGLKKGDRLMLIPDTTMFDITGTPYTSQLPSEIVIISKVEQILDRTIIEFEGSLMVNRGTSVKAYRLGRSFKHFGHNAPTYTTSLSGTPPQATQTLTNFSRDIYTTSFGSTFYSQLLETEMPLDQKVDDLAVGNPLICQGFTQFDGIFSPVAFVVQRQIQSIRSDSLVWGNLTGSTAVVTVQSKLIANDDILFETSDIRQIQFHEVKSLELTLRAPSLGREGDFSDTLLNFFGTYAQAKTLADRTFLIQKAETTQLVKVTSPESSFSLTGRDEVHPWLWPVTLDQQPSFLQQDFDEQAPTVTVYGNLVHANQGKAEKDAVLGNGDSRQLFQTFKLPKAPLTYFTSKSETPPEVPELQIYVNERLWQRVPSLFNRQAKEEIYIVREDANGDSWVQFGDGKTGARLPSGLNNIKAKYRTGIGAYGPQKEGTTVQGGKLDRLDKVWLPGVVSGGSQPETGENAKEAAPGKIQSLGRLVSLRDFETETLAISGVSKVSAAWQLVDNVPAVVLTVLMENGREPEIASVRSILATYNRCRGPQRFPIIVHPGTLKFIYLDLTLSISPRYQTDLVSAAIKAALGNTDAAKGLLGLQSRQFGQPEYANRIEAIAQNVEGVIWTKVTALGLLLGSGADPKTLTLPPEPKPFDTVLACNPDQILSLDPTHLSLNFSTAPAEEEC